MRNSLNCTCIVRVAIGMSTTCLQNIDIRYQVFIPVYRYFSIKLKYNEHLSLFSKHQNVCSTGNLASLYLLEFISFRFLLVSHRKQYRIESYPCMDSKLYRYRQLKFCQQPYRVPKTPQRLFGVRINSSFIIRSLLKRLEFFAYFSPYTGSEVNLFQDGGREM